MRPLGGIRSNQRHQVLPGNYLLHLLKKLTLAGFLGGEIEAEIELLHRLDC